MSHKVHRQLLIAELGSDGINYDFNPPNLDKIVSQKDFAELCGVPLTTFHDNLKRILEICQQS